MKTGRCSSNHFPAFNVPVSLSQPCTSLIHVVQSSYNCRAQAGVYSVTMNVRQFKFYGIAACIAVTTFNAPAQPLVVHEWGTFTALQDETGRTLGGLNTDDEPVPSFCHDLDSLLVARPGELPPIAYKGVASCLPDVTMRL